ncbi:hypothetical protein [Photobacterium atrarenae]|uniref:Uncharacterized protein n=1 Tax=Photobacterium atrarenae TaxID=865757 RepID=A0ABY5GC15_9GAMM|nr:hypothetical protein [Photobacterium atrarenae]UTV26749.1 hypothetical protein NNL38_10310 [Photobacterium atrarenae]
MLIFNKRYSFMPQFTTAAHDPETTPSTKEREVQRQALLALAQKNGGYDNQKEPKQISE